MQDYQGVCSCCGKPYIGTTSCTGCLTRYLQFVEEYWNDFPYGIKARFVGEKDYRKLYKIYFPNGPEDEKEYGWDRELTKEQEAKIEVIYRSIRARQDEVEERERQQRAQEKATFAKMDPRRFGKKHSK